MVSLSLYGWVAPLTLWPRPSRRVIVFNGLSVLVTGKSQVNCSPGRSYSRSRLYSLLVPCPLLGFIRRNPEGSHVIAIRFPSRLPKLVTLAGTFPVRAFSDWRRFISASPSYKSSAHSSRSPTLMRL